MTRRGRLSFSLTELIIVVIILGIIAAIAVPRLKFGTKQVSSEANLELPPAVTVELVDPSLPLGLPPELQFQPGEEIAVLGGADHDLAVKVMNIEPVVNKQLVTWQFGDRCHVFGFSNTVVVWIVDGDDALVEYRHSPLRLHAIGTECAAGTIFFVPLSELSQWRQKEAETLAQNAKQMERVKNLLAAIDIAPSVPLSARTDNGVLYEIRVQSSDANGNGFEEIILTAPRDSLPE